MKWNCNLNYTERVEQSGGVEYELRKIKGGNYYKLLKDGKVWMYNKPELMIDYAELFEKAKGDVLVVGLGMGACLRPLMDNAMVRSVTVWERDEHLIGFMDKELAELRVDFSWKDLTVKWCDVWEGKEGYAVEWDAVWLDIWQMKAPLNAPDIDELKSRFGSAVWIGATWEDECKHMMKELEKARELAKK